MKKELDNVKFNLTPTMYLELIKFNNIKKDLLNYKKSYDLEEDPKLLIKINELENKLVESRNKFIKEFRMNNKDEINRYLQEKDQN